MSEGNDMYITSKGRFPLQLNYKSTVNGKNM